MKCRNVSPAAALLLAISLLVSMAAPSAGAVHENTHQNSGNQAVDAVSVALTQLGYQEGEKGYSKYGEWYGLPNSHWCAMFVSWCMDEAGVSSKTVKPFATCLTAMQAFQKAGLWQESPYRGGTYVPKLGDLIFYDWYGTGGTKHVGIVLYAENGWVYSIEGNTSANRLDRTERFLVTNPNDNRENEDSIVIDEVIVRAHELDSIYIRGYATPKYAGTAIPAALEGIVDLPADTKRQEEIQRVLAAGLMEPMSSHTFGHEYGVTRGEYVAVLGELFGVNAIAPETAAFVDVGTEHPHHDAILAFRSAGIVNGTGDNRFDPDSYITASAAKVLLDRLCSYMGVEPAGAGYVGNLRHGFLQRYELAHALCLLLDRAVAPKPFTASMSIDGATGTLAACNVGGVTYVTAADWQAFLASSEAAFSLAGWADWTPAAPDRWMQRVSFTLVGDLPAEPAEDGGRLEEESAAAAYEASAFILDGTRWYKLRDLAAAMGISVGWDAGRNIVALSTVPEAAA